MQDESLLFFEQGRFSQSEQQRILGDWFEKTVLRPRLCGDVRCLFIALILGSDDYAFSESGLEEVHSLREKAVREDIARRLGNVCSNFSQDEFDELVAVMAARQLRCERRAVW